MGGCAWLALGSAGPRVAERLLEEAPRDVVDVRLFLLYTFIWVEVGAAPPVEEDILNLKLLYSNLNLESHAATRSKVQQVVLQQVVVHVVIDLRLSVGDR
jgi:hypothetical protein